jgi:arylsulfatase
VGSRLLDHENSQKVTSTPYERRGSRFDPFHFRPIWYGPIIKPTNVEIVVMRNNLLILGLVAVAAFVVISRNEQVVATDDLDRTRLPIAQPAPAPVTEALPENVPLPTPWEVKPPKGAPNVVIVLLDDIGFGGPSPFGGPINMPTLQKLADNGLSYNRFHTIALCAPTRAALKTGRNHHQVNMGSIPEIATGYAGNTTVVPDNAAPIAEVLRQNGFATGAFGKWHETPSRETTAGGPQTRWPTRQGFEKFYGFLGAEENMYEPSLHDGVTIIDTPDKPNYHFLEGYDGSGHCLGPRAEEHAPRQAFLHLLLLGGVTRTASGESGMDREISRPV